MRTKTLSLILTVLLAVAITAAAAGAGAEPRTDSTPAAPVEAVPGPVVTGVTQVDAGFNLSCARTTTGQVQCWGINDHGELGLGDTQPRRYAAPVRNAANTGPLQNVLQVAVGDDHACALLASRQVRCWGENSKGELGAGDVGPYVALPVPVLSTTGTGVLSDVRAIGAESDGACALLFNGQMRCWGEDDYGQLGDGAPLEDQDVPVVVRNVPDTGPLTGVTQIDPGYDNACARLSNAQVRCWGYNADGQLGNGTDDNSNRPVVVLNLAGGGPLTGVSQVSIGGYQGCVRLANGQARCWGENDDGEVGDGTDDQRDLPVVVRNGLGTGPLTGVAEIYAGYDHTCARVTGGQARCWGSTDDGQVGDGTVLDGPDRLLPRAVRNGADTANLSNVAMVRTNQFHTCVVLGSGRVACWGENEDRQLGNGATVDKALPVFVRGTLPV